MKKILLLLLIMVSPVFADTSGTKYSLRSNLKNELHISGSRIMQGDLDMGGYSILDAKNMNGKNITVSGTIDANDITMTGDLTLDAGDITAGGTIQGLTLTDGVTTITGGNYTGVGNITGSDIDTSAGTGDYLSSGIGAFGKDITTTGSTNWMIVDNTAGFPDFALRMGGNFSSAAVDGFIIFDTGGATEGYLYIGGYDVGIAGDVFYNIDTIDLRAENIKIGDTGSTTVVDIINGSLDVDTSITAGIGITGTTGNILASTGSFEATVGNAEIAGHVNAGTSVSASTFVKANTYVEAADEVRIGCDSEDNQQPILSMVGDADSDVSPDETYDTLTLTLTPNADPTLATWDFTSTQSAGYKFDKDLFSTGLVVDTTTLVVNAVGYEDRVGIGTATPCYILEIDAGEIGDHNYDGLRIVDTGWDMVSHPMLEFYNSNELFNGPLVRIYGEIGNLGTNSKLYFAVADSSKNLQDRMVIDKGGNVGIGLTTIDANYKLIVRRAANINLGIGLQETELAIAAFNDAISANIPMRFYASEYNLLNGNVGINVTDPDAKLEVVGTLHVSDAATFDSTLDAGSATIGDGTNEIQVSTTGDLLFAGTATVWNDLQFQISDAKVTPASLLPSWEAFTANTSEYAFSVNNEVDTSANEIPHWWKQGTAGSAHMHITTKAINNTEVTYAKFTVTFAYADTNEVWVEAPLTAERTIANPTAALTNLYLDLGDITLTDYLIETQIRCRVKRIAATTGTEYAGDIFITQVGIHFERDAIGSRTEVDK